MYLLVLLLFAHAALMAQETGPVASLAPTPVDYQGRTVSGRVLRVSSHLPIPADSAWAWVQQPALLVRVAHPKIRFVPVNGPLPPRWQAGDTTVVRMRLWGWLPFGGQHHLLVTQIDPATRTIATHEWDRQAKVWNHRIQVTPTGPGTCTYVDEITLYGGWLTPLIATWAKAFYRHRQRGWQDLAQKGIFDPAAIP